jgi:hypothetical protein
MAHVVTTARAMVTLARDPSLWSSPRTIASFDFLLSSCILQITMILIEHVFVFFGKTDEVLQMHRSD